MSGVQAKAGFAPFVCCGCGKRVELELPEHEGETYPEGWIGVRYEIAFVRMPIAADTLDACSRECAAKLLESAAT